MKKVLAFVAVVALAAIAYFAYQSNKTQAPDANKVVKLRLESFALALNPATLSDIESRRVATLLHVGLVRLDQNNLIRPGVAERWQSDGKTSRFTIKKGLTFSDGAAATPDEVVKSLCASMQPTANYSWALSSIRHTKSADGKAITCDGIRAAGDEITIEETNASSTLMDALAGPGGWVTHQGVVPAKYADVPGLGPYKIQEVVPDASVTLVARSNAALAAQVGRVEFHLITDDALAATKFKSGELSALDLSTPTLVALLKPDELVRDGRNKIQQVSADKLRVAIVGEKQLEKKGFSAEQVRIFKTALSASVPRGDIASRSGGIAIAHAAPFVIDSAAQPAKLDMPDVTGLPKVQLTIITEGDTFSDAIAAGFPKQIGPVQLDYKAVDKGLLIQSIVTGNFDLASVVIEATSHSTEFWTAFFNPASPFSAFGKPLSGLGTQPIAEQLRRIAQEGNWIGIVREQRRVVAKSNVDGIRFTPSGQVSYEEVQLR